jgi:S1-C subfamily serine protease
MILGIVKGTPCDKAGMRYGDILLRVNGQPTPSYAAYVDAKTLRADGMEIVYFRDGREHTVSIEFAKRGVEVNATALLAELADMRLIENEFDKPIVKPSLES